MSGCRCKVKCENDDCQCDDHTGIECDYEMDCNCEGLEPEWNWNDNQQAYVCSGCGAIQ